MNDYNKEKIKDFKNLHLTTWWWNFGKKTKDFEGTILDYFTQHEVKYSIKTIKQNNNDFESLKFKCSFEIGSLSFKFEGYDLENLARMVLNIRLSYMGDKAKYILGNKEWSNNFHRK